MAAALGLWAAGPATAQDADPYTQRFADICAACHGAQGVSSLPLTPSLAGQPSFYAITQLFLFREGRRDNALMNAVAKNMSDDLRGYSELIARLPVAPAPAAPAAQPARMERGAALTRRLHCVGCHGADFSGGKQVPRLAGQREDYLRHALGGFRMATRIGYTPAMSEALAGVSTTELDDLAYYLANFAPGTAR